MVVGVQLAEDVEHDRPHGAPPFSAWAQFRGHDTQLIDRRACQIMYCVRGIPMAVENDLVPLVLTDQGIVLFGKRGDRFTIGEGGGTENNREPFIQGRRPPVSPFRMIIALIRVSTYI